MSYEFMDDVLEALDYIDAMYNDGVECESVIENHLRETEDDGFNIYEPSFIPANELAMQLESTWNDIETLPEVPH